MVYTIEKLWINQAQSIFKEKNHTVKKLLKLWFGTNHTLVQFGLKTYIVNLKSRFVQFQYFIWQPWSDHTHFDFPIMIMYTFLLSVYNFVIAGTFVFTTNSALWTDAL